MIQDNSRDGGNGTRQLAALGAPTLRSLIAKANGLGVLKDDIVDIMRENEAYILLYYRDDTDEEG